MVALELFGHWLVFWFVWLLLFLLFGVKKVASELKIEQCDASASSIWPSQMPPEDSWDTFLSPDSPSALI